ncbi:hypothetical protein GCM10009834_18540 [Streptomonospora arabica]|uniref:Uncharacterized protein n=1 Tax=Streptomonospora halophila TaxID=427369 RepID=A0ABP9GEU5_9ACTN
MSERRSATPVADSAEAGTAPAASRAALAAAATAAEPARTAVRRGRGELTGADGARSLRFGIAT